jgi:hypothetical protein
MPEPYLAEFFPRVLQALVDAGGDWGRLDWNGVQLKTRPKEVVCMPMQGILDHLALMHIQFFVLDTEGAELSILKTIDWSRVRFDVMVIEATTLGLRTADYSDAVISYIRAASRGRYVAAHGGQHGYARGRDIWLRHRDFKPSKCLGLFDDAPLSVAGAGFVGSGQTV